MSGIGTLAAGRRAARLAAIQALYEMEFSGKSVEDMLMDMARRRDVQGEEGDEIGAPPAETDMNFCADLVRGVCANTDDIDAIVLRAMGGTGRGVDKMESILRAIVRAGAYEIGRRRDIDPPVTISEFVHIAERFFNDNEPGLVNGLLDRIARDLRPDDMSTGKRAGESGGGTDDDGDVG
jgi:N utilization substance protein B